MLKGPHDLRVVEPLIANGIDDLGVGLGAHQRWHEQAPNNDCMTELLHKQNFVVKDG